MQATLKRTWMMLDYSMPNGRQVVNVEAGVYELQRIRNPLGAPEDWLVIKGTTKGQSESNWRRWQKGQIVDNPGHLDHGKPADWGDWEIIMEE